MCDEMPGGQRAPAASEPMPVTMWLYVTDCDASFRRALDAAVPRHVGPHA